MAKSSAPRSRKKPSKNKKSTMQPRSRRHTNGRAPRITMKDVHAAAKRVRNWGRWGADDEIGTLNFTTPTDIVAAARLVRKGATFSLALNYDQHGPQGTPTKYPALGRFNPIHVMLRDGTDAYSGVLDHRGIRGADDIVILPTQCGTQWDGLGHIFYGDNMYNGYDCREVTSSGANKCGIEKTRNKMVGRGVLLDIARLNGMKWLPEGYAISNAHLDEAAARQGVEIRSGDFVLVRTGHIEEKLAKRDWSGYAGDDAPGLAFETLDWLQAKQVAAVATDTWGAEVRPNQTKECNQPWHWVAIPNMGLTVGEIFYFKELAEDCARDKQYEFLFVAPALPITGAIGSPVNPLAIK